MPVTGARITGMTIFDWQGAGVWSFTRYQWVLCGCQSAVKFYCILVKINSRKIQIFERKTVRAIVMLLKEELSNMLEEELKQKKNDFEWENESVKDL